MAEEKQPKPQKTSEKIQKKEKTPEKVAKKPQQEEYTEVLVRIMGFDIPGSKNIYPGLTRIKGVSWAISNALCQRLNIPHTKKISELSKEDIKKIEAALLELKVYDFMKNRRFDMDTGESSHLYGHDLDTKKEFDIKRMRKMKSYKGVRHALGQPVRGQRTRSHFRARGRGSVGIKKNIK